MSAPAVIGDLFRGRMLAVMRDLVAAQAGGEAAVQAVVERHFRSMGDEVETEDHVPAEVPLVGEFAAHLSPERRRSVIARRRGTGGGKSLFFFAHPDSEPLRDLDRWTRPPFAGEIEDNRFYGWGVADDLAGIAMMIGAAMILAEGGARPAGDLAFVSAPSKRHARGISAVLHAGLSADAAVYLHPAESGAGLAEIKAFASGQIEFSVTVTGQAPDTTEPLQTAFAHLGISPIAKAEVLIEALRRLDRERDRACRHPLLDAAVGRSTNLMISHIASGSPDTLSKAPTTCTFGGALSFAPPEALDDVRHAIEAALGHATDADPWLSQHAPHVTFLSGTSAAETPLDSALYLAAAAAVAEITGERPFVNALHTGSDIRNPIVQRGIPTIGLGPLGGSLTQNGQVDEWVDWEDVLRGTTVAARLAARWCV